MWSVRVRAGRRDGFSRRFRRPLIEALEPRQMLAYSGLPPAIVVGRTLSAYSLADVQNNELQLTYTVYNRQGEDVKGVLLVDTLASDVAFKDATQLPDRSGQDLAWSLGTIAGYGRASVTLTVSVGAGFSTSPRLDTGARAFAALNAGMVTDEAPPATLRATAIPAALLASTPDANTVDPFVQAQAAELNYDPQNIFDFLHTEIGYNSYTGSLRGARGTLWSSAGNALDVASLGVALLRASGVPARYAQGTLSEELAQDLILSMFPSRYQYVGHIPAGTHTADPARDARLLAETKSHYWYQFDAGQGWQDADPLLPGASANTAFATALTTFIEVPDDLRHKLQVTLDAEIFTQAENAFGGTGLTTTTVLSQTFNDVELVGRPVTVGNLVSAKAAGGLIFVTTTNTYSPYLAISDESSDPSLADVIRGTDYQEVVSNFPLGNQFLTGLFLSMTLTGPGDSPSIYRKTLLDRIGFAARQNGGGQTQFLSVSSSQAALSDLDLVTINALPGLQSPRVLGMAAVSLNRFQDELDALRPEVSGIPTSGPATPDQHHVAARAAILERQIALATTQNLGILFALTSDRALSQLETGYATKAYYGSPRLLVSTSQQAGDQVTVAFDLVKNDLRVLTPPGQAVVTPYFFEVLRGYMESTLEGQVLSLATGRPSLSMSTILDALADQGGHVMFIARDNLPELDRLPLSPTAKARITDAVVAGRTVLTPTQMVNINSKPIVGWMATDYVTGHTINVMEDGSHGAMLEYVVPFDSPTNLVAASFIGTMHGFANSLLGFVAEILDDIPPDRSIEEIIKEAKLSVVEDLKQTYAELLVGVWSPEGLSGFQELGFQVAQALGGLAVGPLFFDNPPSPVEVAAAVAELVLDRSFPGFGTVSLYMQAGLVAGAALGIAWITSNLPGDPPVFPFLSTNLAFLRQPNATTAALPATPQFPAGMTQATADVPSVRVGGQVTASWQPLGTSGTRASRLDADLATVQDSSGRTIGSGIVTFAADRPVPVAVSGNARFSVSGAGDLAFYGPVGSLLGVSVDWGDYVATLSGDVWLALATDGLLLNGQVLPSGKYTINTESATLSGHGVMTSPNFSGSASLSTDGATVEFGRGSGAMNVESTALDSANGVTLAGFKGSIAVAAGAADKDSVTLSGNAEKVLALSANPRTLKTDQNTPVSFHALVQSSFADTYDLTAQAPPGWTVTVETNGNVTATPAPGLQEGAYPIRLVAKSASQPDLVAQCVAEVTIGPTTAGFVFSVQPDTLTTVPFQGAQVPTAFQATVHNTGPTLDTFRLTFPTLPSGFEVLQSSDSIAVPAGETGVIGIYLEPAGLLPAPGTPVSFSATATGASDPTTAKTVAISFDMPEVRGVRLASDPVLLNSAPGGYVSATLTISVVGNVPETVALRGDFPSGLSSAYLPDSVTLEAGQVLTQTILLFPAADTPLNSTLTATVTAEYGPASAPITAILRLPVGVVVPGALSIANASVSAAQLGYRDLASRLQDLGDALTDLVQAPSSDLFKDQVLANIDAISGLIASAHDPLLVTAEEPLAAAKVELNVASTSDETLAAVNRLGAALDWFATVIADEVKHGFRFALDTNSAVALPAAPTRFNLVLQNTGNRTTTYDFSLHLLPFGVSAALSQTSVTLSPGEAIGVMGSDAVTLTITPPATELAPFTFGIQARAREAYEITRSVFGLFTVRNELVRVTEVIATPAFTEPGGQVAVAARLFNAVNRERAASVSYQVLDSKGTVVFTSTPVPTQLTVQAALTTVQLGDLNTSMLSNGSYTLRVTATGAAGMPIPGATGDGTLLVGTPVSASLSVDRQSVPPDNASVVSRLRITGQIPLPSPLTLIGQAATAPTAMDVAVRGGIAYVAGSEDVSIIDIGDPTNPTVVKTFGENDLVQGGTSMCRIAGDNLIVASTLRMNASQFRFLVYSLADPADPRLLSSTTIPYPFPSDLFVSGTTAFIPTQGAYYLFGALLVDQFGDFLSVNISDPNSPGLTGVLFNNRGPSDGGDTAQSGGAIVNEQIAYVASTTSTGSAPVGVGRVLIVDISDPTHMSVVRELQIPGTVHLVDIAVQGQRALVVGSTGGRPGDWSGPWFTGQVTLTVLDITDPLDPQILGSTLVTDGEYAPYFDGRAGVSVLAFGSDGYAVSGVLVDGEPLLLLADAHDPSHIATIQVHTSSLVNGMDLVGDRLYTTSSDGMGIYRLGEMAAIPYTARVEIPKGTGVAVVPNSFNIAPSEVISGTEFDTLIWKRTLAADSADDLLSWKTDVNDLLAGEARHVTLDSTIDFVSQGVAGSLSLPNLTVSSEQILALEPASQTIHVGQAASYGLTVKNPWDGERLYFFGVSGIPSSWVDLTSHGTVPANGSWPLTLTLRPDATAAIGKYDFAVTANRVLTTAGVVHGTLVVTAPPAADPEAHVAQLTLTPSQAMVGQATPTTYTVRLTNLGSATDTFSLSSAGLPAGFVATFAQSNVDVPPGLSNFRDVGLTVHPVAGTGPGDYAFTVTAASTAQASATSTANGTLTVLSNGVHVALSPAVSPLGGTFQMTVTNVGQVEDTFKLTLAGPAGPVASLETNSVTLAPTASQTVNVTVGGIDFVLPGSLPLTAIATSQTNAEVRHSATAGVQISAHRGLSAEGSPALTVLPQPGGTSVLLLVHNLGNVEDQYQATITGTTGPLSANLTGLDGLTTQTVPMFRLPGLSDRAILLQANLEALGTGTVTVQVATTTPDAPVLTAAATVTIVGPPSLSFSLDPTSDSGVGGDDLTRFTTVQLIGTTEPGQEVLLDVDGDGFDDGQGNADGNGQFAFGAVPLAGGANFIRLQATNEAATTEASRSIVLDTQPPSGVLVNPAPGGHTGQTGYVEVQWTDAGAAGLDPATFDIADVTLPGVVVDRVENMGDGRMRYWYNDDGELLTVGQTQVTLESGQVGDMAGNMNASPTAFLFTVVPPWQNPVFAFDVSDDRFVTPSDVLAIVNWINRDGNRLLPIPPVPPDAPPPFVDTNGDNYLTPQDVLLVINYINGYGSGPLPELEALDGPVGAAAMRGADGEPSSATVIPVAWFRAERAVGELWQTGPVLQRIPMQQAPAERRSPPADGGPSPTDDGIRALTGGRLRTASYDAVHAGFEQENLSVDGSLTRWLELEDALDALAADDAPAS